jgi:hypothetical protein
VQNHLDLGLTEPEAARYLETFALIDGKDVPVSI